LHNFFQLVVFFILLSPLSRKL